MQNSKLVILLLALCITFVAASSTAGVEAAERDIITKIGYWENDSSINDVVANNNYLYAISDYNLYILDASNPSNPTQIGTFNSGGSEIVLSGDYAIISNGATLSILNVSDPNNIFQEGQYQATGYEEGAWGSTTTADDVDIKAISIQGNVVYGIKIFRYWGGIGGTDPFLIIIDISNPKQPNKISSLYVGSWAQLSSADDIEVLGNYVYIVDSYDMGLQIVNTLDLINPVTLSTTIWPYAVLGEGIDKIYIRGNYAYISKSEGYSNTSSWVYIIDITDPNNVIDRSSFEVSGKTIGLMSDDSYLYTISDLGLLRIIDITDPVNPLETAYDDTLSGLNNISGNDNNFFIAADGGVYIYNYYGSPTQNTLPEDFNEDGSVDLEDLNELAGAYGSKDNTKYDLNEDGVVNIFDLVILSRKIS